jgi:hypothetical protein
VLQRLQKNKDWLDTQYAILNRSNTNGMMNARELETWVAENWEYIADFISKSQNIVSIDVPYGTKPGSEVLDLRIKANNIPNWPNGGYIDNEVLGNFVNSCFQERRNYRGNSSPSKYHKICEFINLFSLSDENYIDAKFYDDLPEYVIDYETEYNRISNTN